MSSKIKTKNEFKRNETQLHLTPDIVITTMPLFIIGIVIALIVAIVMLIKQNMTGVIVCLSIAAVFRLYGAFVDIYFDFYRGYTLVCNDNNFKINYSLAPTALTNSVINVTIDVNDITKVKKSKNKLKVFGSVTRKQQHQKDKVTKSIIIPLKGFDNSDIIYEQLKSYI